MKKTIAAVALGIATAMAAGSAAWAEKPDWAGGGDHSKEHKADRSDHHRNKHDRGAFSEDERRAISNYYDKQARSGKCPPGLAKKHKGCSAPGQAKKWHKGQPLPADVTYNELPRELVQVLPPPPPQHRYVQVAGDILMIAVGTSMVVDAVQDIFR